jgi:hypothetical protein
MAPMAAMAAPIALPCGRRSERRCSTTVPQHLVCHATGHQRFGQTYGLLAARTHTQARTCSATSGRPPPDHPILLLPTLYPVASRCSIAERKLATTVEGWTPRPHQDFLTDDADTSVEIPHIRLPAAAAVQSTRLSPVVRPAQANDRRSSLGTPYTAAIRRPTSRQSKPGLQYKCAYAVCAFAAPLHFLSSGTKLVCCVADHSLGPISASRCLSASDSRRAPPLSLSHSV